MQTKTKKLLSVLVAGVMATSTLALTSCGEYYTADALPGSTAGTVVSNGGAVVAKGDYVYFLNGKETHTANNTYGEVEKGALMRISKTALAEADYSNADVVVPLVISPSNTDNGFFIYDDYVYFATPTADKDLDGNVMNTWLDFKCAKLDGSKVMKDYFFRISDFSADFRFVEIDGTVYCLYVDGASLKSYNTKTDVTTTLVKDATSEFIFDDTDKTNPVVYYTMPVSYRIGTTHETDVAYNQVYSVSADATYTLNANEASYTVTDGRTYDFDLDACEDNVSGFDKNDVTTYPYVNLGTLVLDGIGSDSEINKPTQFNNEADLASATPSLPNGYLYTLQSYQNGGLYYSAVEAGITADQTPVYYLDETITAQNWNTVAGNEQIDVVAKNNENASGTAFYLVDKTATGNVHTYFYNVGTDLVRTIANNQGDVQSTVTIAEQLTVATFLYTQGDYLFVAATGSNGNYVYRVNYTGDADDYHPILQDLTEDSEYAKTQILNVDYNNAWFKPELIDNYLFFSNAQAFNANAYNYTTVVNLQGSNTDGSMKTAELKAFGDKYQAIADYMKEVADEDSEVLNVLQYYYRTGETALYEAVEEEYSNKQKTVIEAFFAYDGKHKDYRFESYFFGIVGKVTETDATAMSNDFASSLIVPVADEETADAFPVWAIVLIAVGGALVVGAGVAVPVILHIRKKKKLEADRQATRVRKKKIDTTDDKSIDVYATDEPQTATESTENSATETAETTDENN